MSNKNGSPKKRNKKNNMIKRSISLANFGTSDLYFVFIGGHKETFAFDKKELSPVAVTPSIANSVHSLPFEWSIYLAVLCKRQDGQRYTKSIERRFKAPYRRDIIENYLNEEHQKLINKSNKLHIVNIGWIASTNYHVFDDDVSDQLFERQGGWNHTAVWEERKIVKEMPNVCRCPVCKKFVSKSDYRIMDLGKNPCNKCLIKKEVTLS